MNNTQKLLKWASIYETKQASINFDLDNVKRLVKGAIEKMWETYPTTMDGFLFVSNVSLGPEFTIAFTLNLDKNKQDVINTNKTKRDNLINTAVKAELKKTYNQDFDLGFQDVLV